MQQSLALLLGTLLFAPFGSETVTIRVRGVKPLYLNDKGQSTPVDIRIYALKDDARFAKAGVDDLWLKDKEVLGEDRLGVMKQATVVPGAADDDPQSVELREVPDQFRFIGILALMNKEDNVGPRKLVLSRKELAAVLRLTGTHIEREK